MDANLVKWAAPPPKVRFAVFEHERDVVIGGVVAYTPLHGAQNYERTAQVGALVLQVEPGQWVKIGLDKEQLATAVENAVRQAEVTFGPCLGSRNLVMAVRFMGWSKDDKKGYKVFKVTPGFLTDGDELAALWGDQ